MPAPAQHKLTESLDFNTILKVTRPGDRMTYKDRFDQEHTGRVQIAPLRGDMAHFVLNMGGRHGTPAVVNEKNFVALKPSMDRRQTVADDIARLTVVPTPSTKDIGSQPSSPRL